MKSCPRLLLSLLFSSLLLFAGCTVSSGITPPENSYITDIPSPTPVFSQFAMDIFCEEVSADTISLHYSLSSPAAYGISEPPAGFGSVFNTEESGNDAESLYTQLLSYSTDSLSEEEQKTYHALERHLNLLMADDSSPYLSELLGPVTGFQAQLPILLAEYRFEEESDIISYLSLLSETYDFFKEIAAFEQEKSRLGFFMDDTTANEIILQCLDFVKDPDHNFLISTFEERLETLPLSIAKKTDYILQNRNALFSSVFPAYELLADTLSECLGSGTNPYGLCYLNGGKEYYSHLANMTTGSDKTVPELKQLLTDAVDTACLTMASLLAADSSLYTQALSPSFPETDPESILSYIISSSKEDFPYIDCGSCIIKYIPESLQDHVSPAMYLTPPLDSYESNVIYINPNPVYDADALFPTMIHEGYPGHLYQTVSALSSDIHPLRYLLTPTGYAEGWATYVENYSYLYCGFSDSLAAFLQANHTASLCLYALSDICIHYDGYTPEELSSLLAVYGFPKETSFLIYQTLLSEPAAYLPYAVGFLEFMELKETARELWEKDYSDYRFHSFLLESGPMPFSQLRELLF